MDADSVRAALRELPLGGLRVFERIGSTNDEALAWAARGARDFSLVLADEQTKGRGRLTRRWHTPAGMALAFSLILRPTAPEARFPMRLSGLASLAIADALANVGLQSAIKWPNDVLVGGRKLAGILVECTWKGAVLDSCVIGIGLNAFVGSIPEAKDLRYPATSVETELGTRPERLTLLHDVLAALAHRRDRIATAEFKAAWEDRLAFRGQNVILSNEDEDDLQGMLVGLDADGSLLLMTGEDSLRVQMGELRLRQSGDKIG